MYAQAKKSEDEEQPANSLSKDENILDSNNNNNDNTTNNTISNTIADNNNSNVNTIDDNADAKPSSPSVNLSRPVPIQFDTRSEKENASMQAAVSIAASKSTGGIDEDTQRVTVARPHHISKMQPLSSRLDDLKKTLGTEVCVYMYAC